MSQQQLDDLSITKKVMSNPPARHAEESWLRHKGQAGLIDFLLLSGATIDHIVSAIRENALNPKKQDIETLRKRVKRHLAHLTKEEHHLPVKQVGEKWQFDI
jgi:hypothetical protein